MVQWLAMEAHAEHPRLSVVVLCYHEGESLRAYCTAVANELDKLEISYELLAVSNYWEGDSDPSPQIARDLAASHLHIRAVTRLKQGKFGWDMRSGLDEARGELVAVIDGDGQIPPDAVNAAYSRFIVGDCDMVMARRVERHDGTVRWVVSRIYNWLFRLLFPKVRVFDANGKPKMFKREMLDLWRLQSDDWFIDAEIIIKASYDGFRIGVIPIEFRARVNNESSIQASSLVEFLKNLLVYRLRLIFGTVV